MSSKRLYRQLELNNRFQKAQEAARKVLGDARQPVYIHEIPHKYQDKYTVVEEAASSFLFCAEYLLTKLSLNGSEDGISNFFQTEMQNEQRLTLRFEHDISFKFVENTTKEKNGKANVTEVQEGGKNDVKTVKKSTHVKACIWDVNSDYRLFAYSGASPETNKLDFYSSNTSDRVVTIASESPESLVRTPVPKEVDITELLKLNKMNPFSINRTADDCHTPRRNEEIEKVLKSAEKLNQAFFNIRRSIFNTLALYEQHQSIAPNDLLESIAADVVIPILPFIEKTDGDGAVFSPQDSLKMCLAFQKSVEKALERVNGLSFDGPKTSVTKVIGIEQCILVLLSLVFEGLYIAFCETVDHIEGQLRAQVVAAIGKHISSSHITEYMEYHNRKIFESAYKPNPFLYEVRRAGYSPEGSISIEYSERSHPVKFESNRGEGGTIYTHSITRLPEPSKSVRFSLNASKTIELEGQQYLHGYVAQSFCGDNRRNMQLVARARQFSTFVLMIGTIAEGNQFQPKHSLIVSNKDRIIIPLICELLPSAKEFRDAIDSLSPEQQRFTRAYRQLQLESTVFALAVIPVKNSLEAVLNLPDGALTKHIKLTQDILKLFLEYQIPSDLLSYVGSEASSIENKIESVSSNVSNILTMIQEEKELNLKERKQEHEFVNPEAAVELAASLESQGSCMPPAQVPYFQSPVYSTMSHQPGPIRFKGASSTSARRSFATFPPVANVSMTKHVVADTMDDPIEDAIETFESIGESDFEETEVLDFTRVPKKLEQYFDRLDIKRNRSKVLPTKIFAGKSWSRSRKKNLLAKEETTTLTEDEKTSEKSKTMDLLDALTRSGELPLKGCSFHVIIAVTQSFEQTVMDTLIKSNSNPIVSLERTSVVMATAIQGKTTKEMLNKRFHDRILSDNPEIASLLDA
mmetsp:Transcript_15554/g.20454  ORF Transcript_15554/g.20454 Transcript_15554/m.20454 type:complete len:918 (-) Transcript_15554:164-2917(-)